MKRTQPIVVFLSFLCLAAQPSLAGQDAHSSASIDGATGLFTLWDAEPIRSGEMNFGFAAHRYNRDPGQLSITRFPISGAIGAFGFLEFFGSFDVQKRIEAGSIQVDRIGPGEIPRPATTRLGEVLFTNEALFMDVRQATGRGDLRGGVKINILSERRNHPVSLSGVAFGQIPTQDNYLALRRGLSSHTKSGGFGALFSKRFDDMAQFHANFLVNMVRSPRGEFVKNPSSHADVGHEFIYRVGMVVPNKGQVQLIGELNGTIYAADYTAGLNPVDPVDLILGARFFPKGWAALSAGYRLSVNHIAEDAARQVFPRDRHGFIFQLGFALRD